MKMIKSIGFTIFIVFIMLSACNREGNREKVLEKYSTGSLKHIKLEVKKGMWVKYSYFEDGSIAGIAHYTDKGIKSGPQMSFYKDLRLESFVNFKNGKQEGNGIKVETDSVLKGMFHYSDGHYDGVGYSYHKNGFLKIKVNYKNGKRNGKYMNFDSNGVNRYTYCNKSDVIHGKYARFDSVGRVEFVVYMNMGSPLLYFNLTHNPDESIRIKTWVDSSILNSPLINKKIDSGLANIDVFLDTLMKVECN